MRFRAKEQPIAPRRKSRAGRIALVVSVIGCLCAGVTYVFLESPQPNFGGLILIASWVLLPIGFILGVNGTTHFGEPKAPSVAAIVTSMVGSGISVFVSAVMFLASAFHYLPN